MNNNQTEYNDDSGNNFVLEYNILPDADIPLEYESGEDDDQKYIFTNKVIKGNDSNKKFLER
jgi:hypothetical protein